MVTTKGMLRVDCLDLGDELVERLLVEFQDTSKVTHYYVNNLGGKYSMSKTTPKDKERLYGIRANNDPPERNFGGTNGTPTPSRIANFGDASK